MAFHRDARASASRAPRTPARRIAHRAQPQFARPVRPSRPWGTSRLVQADVEILLQEGPVSPCGGRTAGLGLDGAPIAWSWPRMPRQSFRRMLPIDQQPVEAAGSQDLGGVGAGETQPRGHVCGVACLGLPALKPLVGDRHQTNRKATEPQRAVVDMEGVAPRCRRMGKVKEPPRITWPADSDTPCRRDTACWPARRGRWRGGSARAAATPGSSITPFL